jgi:hypothetical protein
MLPGYRGAGGEPPRRTIAPAGSRFRISRRVSRAFHYNQHSAKNQPSTLTQPIFIIIPLGKTFHPLHHIDLQHDPIQAFHFLRFLRQHNDFSELHLQ